jgi:hypothetical protein
VSRLFRERTYSLASPNPFPAEFLVANRDRFECLRRRVRVLIATAGIAVAQRLHPRPAKPGELRWFTTGPDGTDIEVEGRGPHLIGGEQVFARSRTYIPARLSDNPDLNDSGYGAVLAGLPEELRRAYRDGDFSAGMKDDDYQVIPAAWIEAAQRRWSPNVQRPAMTAIGLDVAQGGNDTTVLAARYGGWYAALVRKPGKQTRDGSDVAAMVTAARRNQCPVIVDVGGGYGGGTLLRLKDNGIPAIGFNGAHRSTAKTRDGQLAFCNKRAEAWWRRCGKSDRPWMAAGPARRRRRSDRITVSDFRLRGEAHLVRYAASRSSSLRASRMRACRPSVDYSAGARKSEFAYSNLRPSDYGAW